MARTCTADEFAAALVFACRLTGEDPEELFVVAKGGKGRVLALAGLVEHGGFDHSALLRGLRYSGKQGVNSILNQAHGMLWWREDWVRLVARRLRGEAVGALPQPKPIIRRLARQFHHPVVAASGPPPPAAPAVSLPADILKAVAPAPTSVWLGEPEPGRSALASRLAGLDRPSEARHSISLASSSRKGA